MFAIAFAALLAQNASTLTLDQALSRASENDPGRPAAEASADAERARANAVGRRFLRAPQIEIDASRSVTTGAFVDASGGVGISDELDLSARPRNLRAAAELRAEAALRSISTNASERANDALGLVLRIRTLETRRELLDALASNLDAVSKATARRVVEGITGPTDRILAEAEAARIRSDARAVTGEIDERAAQLAILLGLPEAPVISGEPARGAATNVAALTRSAIDRHPTIRELGSRIDAAKSEIAAARSGRTPLLRVGVSLADELRSFDRGSFQGTPAVVNGISGARQSDIVVGAKLGITFPLAPQFRADVAASNAALQALEAERVRRQRELEREIRGAVAARSAAEERLAILDPLQGDLPGAMQRLETAYREGRLALDAYLTQRERLGQLQLSAVDARADRDAADVRLSRALGGPFGTNLLPPENP